MLPKESFLQISEHFFNALHQFAPESSADFAKKLVQHFNQRLEVERSKLDKARESKDALQIKDVSHSISVLEKDWEMVMMSANNPHDLYVGVNEYIKRERSVISRPRL